MSVNNVTTNSAGTGDFAISGRKLSALVVNLLTQDNANLLKELKSGFRRKIRWNKYQSK